MLNRDALSPTFFCPDELLRIQETDVCCHLGHMSYAAFGYGREMLFKTSGTFASEYGAIFNAKKTECICFGKIACPLHRQVYINGPTNAMVRHVKFGNYGGLSLYYV